MPNGINYDPVKACINKFYMSANVDLGDIVDLHQELVNVNIAHVSVLKSANHLFSLA